MQLQFFVLPELILHKYSVEGYVVQACNDPGDDDRFVHNDGRGWPKQPERFMGKM